jgi:hypothetical protein
LRLNLPVKIYKQVLFILHESVIPHLTKPEVLMDFLIGTFIPPTTYLYIYINALY